MKANVEKFTPERIAEAFCLPPWRVIGKPPNRLRRALWWIRHPRIWLYNRTHQ